MRNILEYPITDEEMLNALDRAISEVDFSTLAMGDMHLASLHAARARLLATFEVPPSI
jgi:hypothetical protein